MSMMRWESFNDLMSLRQAMDRLFEDSFVTPGRSFRTVWAAMPVDVYQTENEVVLKATLPGVKPEEVDITVTGDTVTIRGERKADEKVKQEDYIYQEHRYGAFSRTVTLPGGLDTGKAEANFENGVLTLTIPKSEEVKPKQIKVKARGAIEGKK